jgi:hypothetical protein
VRARTRRSRAGAVRARRMARRPFDCNHAPERQGEQDIRGPGALLAQLLATRLDHRSHGPRARHRLQVAIAGQVNGEDGICGGSPLQQAGERAPVPALARQAAQQDPGGHRCGVWYQRPIARSLCCSRSAPIGSQPS